MFEWLLSSLISSLIIGSIYVMVSIGLTLTLAVVKLPNFAHAEFLTIGAYVAVFVTSIYPNNFVVMGFAAFAICGILAVGVHWMVYRPMMNRKFSIYTLVLASFAVALFIRYSVFVGASVANVLQIHPRVNVFVLTYVGNTPITNFDAIVVPLALGVSAFLGLLLTLTSLGKSMRAVASNFELARVSGINLSRVVNTMWVIAGGLAGLGGSLFGIYTIVTPVMGFNTLLDIFAVVIIGGLTSMSGTILGGYIVGLSENTIMDFLNIYFGVPLTYEPLLPFALIVVVLMLKPTGLTPNALNGVSYFKKLLHRFFGHKLMKPTTQV